MNRHSHPNRQEFLSQAPAHPVLSKESQAAFPGTQQEAQVIAEQDTVSPETSLRISDACLTDEQCLAYTLHTLEENVMATLAEHIGCCPVCATEIDRLHHLAHAWDRGQVASQLELRVAYTSPPLLAVMAARSTPLGPLVRPAGAFGEDRNAEEVALHFPIYTHDGTLTEMLGTLIRQQRDYYVHIQPAPNDPLALSCDQRILLTLIDPSSRKSLLQRQVEVGVTVILGTDLKVTNACFVHACLLPVAE